MLLMIVAISTQAQNLIGYGYGPFLSAPVLYPLEGKELFLASIVPEKFFDSNLEYVTERTDTEYYIYTPKVYDVTLNLTGVDCKYTQSLFNDDEELEYIIPIWGNGEGSYVTGFTIKQTNGTIIGSQTFPNREFYVNGDTYTPANNPRIIVFSDKIYIGFYLGNGNSNGWWYSEVIPENNSVTSVTVDSPSLLDETMYNLQGKIITEPKGLYIQGGEKKIQK